eukprot:7169481-Lingulodinium_polyedra.AAC.1
MLSDSVLTAWWKRWGGRGGGSTAVYIELRRICKGEGAATPSETLGDWLRGMGWTGNVLTPHEA